MTTVVDTSSGTQNGSTDVPPASGSQTLLETGRQLAPALAPPSTPVTGTSKDERVTSPEALKSTTEHPAPVEPYLADVAAPSHDLTVTPAAISCEGFESKMGNKTVGKKAGVVIDEVDEGVAVVHAVPQLQSAAADAPAEAFVVVKPDVADAIPNGVTESPVSTASIIDADEKKGER